MSRSIPIQHLVLGQQATISGVTGPAEDVKRLAELGLRAGESIKIVRPGSPCIARVGNRDICLRLDGTVQVTADISEAA